MIKSKKKCKILKLFFKNPLKNAQKYTIIVVLIDICKPVAVLDVTNRLVDGACAPSIGKI